MLWWDFPNQIKEAYQQMVQFLQQFLSFSLSFDGLGIVQWMYGNAITLAPFLAIIVVVFVLPLGLLVKRLRLSAAMSMIVVLIMPILTAAWFIIMQQAQELGDDFTKLAISIGDAPTQARPIDLVIPSSVATDAVITVVMFFALLVWSMILFFIFLGYEVVNVVLSVAGLLLLALYGLGPRTRKTFSIVLALSIVTMLIGRPVGLGIIEIGNMIGASLPGPDNVFFVGAITGVSMMLAIAVQPLLVVGAYRGVSNVMGSINATVRGSVRSVTENKQKLQAQLSGSAPSAMTNRAHRLTETGRAYGRAVGTEAKRAGAASAATALAMTASKAHPVAAVVTTAASIAVKAVGSMPAKSPQSKRSRTDDYR